MGQKTFDMILHLASVGFIVEFSKVDGFKPATVLKVHLRKGDNHWAQQIDISRNLLPIGMNLDDLIARTLEKGRWEFEYDFERERNV